MPDTSAYKTPTAKRLVLSLLSAPDLQEISARQCARWGALFAIEPTAMRVALGRLVKGRFLRSAGRARYTIGDRGQLLCEMARSWIAAEQRVGDWDGQWLVVHTAHLGRRDKSALQARERALLLEGFATLNPGLWCRPGNLLESTPETRERLLHLGLEAGAVLLRANSVLGDDLSLETLWSRSELEARYASLTLAMRDSMRRLEDQDVEVAARETFLLGEAVIRQINSDPLLPATMIDVGARRKMHQTMVAYDAFGRAAWARFQNSSP